jgi:two-component system, NarL family, sensor histidine kinase UhpB
MTAGTPPEAAGSDPAHTPDALAAWETLAVQQVIAAQENERRRVARELHDDIGQALSSLVLVLGLIAEALPPTATRERQLLDDSTAVAANMMAGLRRIIAGLRPPVLDDLGLVPALRQLGLELQDRTGVRVSLASEAAGPRLPPDVELMLFRVAQEALTNVGKHAQAQHAAVLLEQNGGQVRLRIEDDGRGMPAPDPAARPRSPAGHQLGMIGMRERVALLHGRFQTGAVVPHGLWLEVVVPLAGASNGGAG